MRKTINTIALLFFIWLVLDTFNVFNILLNFLIAGEIPFIKIALPPSFMLTLMTVVASVVVFELLARRIEVVSRLRRTVFSYIFKRSRFGRLFRQLDTV